MEVESHKQRIQDIYTMGPMQLGMLYIYLMDKDSKAHLVQKIFKINRELDWDLLQKSFNLIIQKHDILRTVFHFENSEQPLQIVLKHRHTEIPFEDISSWEENKKELRLGNFMEEDRRRGFDLSRDILLRLALFKTGTASYRLAISFHHIIIDGWCLGILFRDLIQTYILLLQGKSVDFGHVIPYRDYIKWLDKQDKKEGVRYWQKYLEGYEQAVVLPKGSPPLEIDREGVHVYQLETYEFSIDEKVVDQLKKTATVNGATLSLVFQAIWGILLHRYNDTNDVVYGMVVSGRPPEIEGIETMVGLFINTIPVRNLIKEKQSFNLLVKEIQEKAVQSKPYEFLPLAETQSLSGLKSELINHIMAFGNLSIGDQMKDLAAGVNFNFEIEEVTNYEQTNYDFNIEVLPGKSFMVRFSFNKWVYSLDSIKRIASHLDLLTRQVAQQPEIKVENIDIMSESEKKQILIDFNDTGTPFPKDKTLPQLFAEQTEKSPDRPAVIGTAYSALPGEYIQPGPPGEKRRLLTHMTHMTYRELNNRSGQLAHLLKERGVMLETIVAIMVEPSQEMIIGLMGILKAGDAYLPIDPEYPPERIQYMLKDSNAQFLIVDDSSYTSRLSFPPKAILNLSEGYHLNFPASQLPSFPASLPSSLAYIIYTSGTTGKPKAAMVEHRSAVRLVKNTNYIEFRTNDRILQTGALEFDASTFEIWGSLLNGLQLFLVKNEIILAAEKIKDIIQRYSITTMWLTSPLFNQLLEQDSEIFRGLKNLLVGGDILSPPHINRLRNQYPKLNIINGYGPTENTTFSTTYLITKEYHERIPIGQPIANSFAFIVDKYGYLQPVGVVGELWVGGDGVARGYLNNPELTAEKFSHDLWDYRDYHDRYHRSSRSHKSYHPYRSYIKIYKTGDLARWLPDGIIEFLGRIDHQVKIRGFRIEPGEIEIHLLAHSDIREAVVLVNETEGGDKYLCAYIVAGERFLSTGDLTTDRMSRLREYLSLKLPDYMIPSYFMQVEKIPLNPSGKVNKKALPIPKIGEVSGVYAAPRTELENQLVAIWSEVLGIRKENIGIDTNFIELGGHSLNAMQLISKIQKQLKIKISLADIFEKRVIRKLADYIEGSVQDTVAPIQPVEKKEYYVLSSAQKSLFIIQQMEPNSISYNSPRSFVFKRTIEKDKLEDIVRQLIKRHETLRTSFDMMGDEPVQKIIEMGDIDFNVTYDELEEKQAKAVLGNFLKPFDLGKPPLLRLGLIRISNEEYILMIDMHHIITDLTSFDIFIREFLVLSQGRKLPGINSHYKDYSEWQHKEMKKEAFLKQENYWLKRFKGGAPLINLPISPSNPVNQGFAANALRQEIEKELVGKLKQLALEEDVTLFMILLSAYYICLSKYTGQEDIVIGAPISGRHHMDLQNIIGMFINTLVMRNFPQKNKTYREFLGEVKKNALDAYENQGYPFEDLVSKLNIPRVPGKYPLYDISFQLIAEIEVAGNSNREFSEYKYNFYTLPYMPISLAITAILAGDRLRLQQEYSTNIFTRTVIEKMMNWCIEILEQVVLNRDMLLKDIEMSHDLKSIESNVILKEEGDFGF